MFAIYSSVNHETVVTPPTPETDEMLTTFETTDSNKPLHGSLKQRVTGARTVGSPYSPRRPKPPP